MDFKFRNKHYRVERDQHQFILSQQYQTTDGIDYKNLGYYRDPAYLIQKLVSLNIITKSDGKELPTLIKTCCEQLGKVLNKAIKAP